VQSHTQIAKQAIQELPPGYFSMVMATGIISLDAFWMCSVDLAIWLSWLNIITFVVLYCMSCVRLVWFPQRLLNDLTDHSRGVGFFSAVAGTCVLGVQFLIVFHDPGTAKFLWWLGITLWMCLIYSVFTAFTIKSVKPTLSSGINGAWLLAIVATQSVSVLGSQLSSHWGAMDQPALFVALAMWLCGGMLYIWMISLIFYRYTFFSFVPSDLAPPYWINMGAVAISTLAGAALISKAPAAKFLTDMLPFLRGFTLFFWATATWWFPMLVILAVWRYVFKRYPIAYDPSYWGLVFPLGMYAACTYRLTQTFDLPFLFAVPRIFFAMGFCAWGLTFFGLLKALFRAHSVTKTADTDSCHEEVRTAATPDPCFSTPLVPADQDQPKG
jgi:tellurite resistance protein TehA-like permease